jgi:hypothetical protein
MCTGGVQDFPKQHASAGSAQGDALLLQVELHLQYLHLHQSMLSAALACAMWLSAALAYRCITFASNFSP